MATDALAGFGTRVTPQNESARTDQVANNAGGFGFAIDDRARARRFLTIGVEGGTFYVGEKDLVVDNAQSLVRLAQDHENARWLVDEAVAISDAGRAPRNNEALFALALVAGTAPSPDARDYALQALPKVARIGTHLFIFARYVEQFRGWGRSLKRAVAAWYEEMPVEKLELQAVKYRQREGWSHRDLLRLAHPKVVSHQPEVQRALYDWIVRPDTAQVDALPLVRAFQEAQAATLPMQAHDLVLANRALTWEMLPDSALTIRDTWLALLEAGMPTGAILRQLPRLTRLGVFEDRDAKRAVIGRLTDANALAKARIHPIKMLGALRTYAQGHSERGSSAWSADADVIDALDAGFYACFRNVVPMNKRTLLALDVSGSMSWHRGPAGLFPSEITAAMSLVTKATEKYDARITAFSHTLVDVGISPRQRLDDVMRTLRGITMGGTDCSLPIVWAAANGIDIDTFVVYTDNETWAGRIHPFQALQAYRQKTGIPAKLVVVATEAVSHSIADPNDPGMLDISGFDSSTPELISAFARGEL